MKNCKIQDSVILKWKFYHYTEKTITFLSLKLEILDFLNRKIFTYNIMGRKNYKNHRKTHKLSVNLLQQHKILPWCQQSKHGIQRREQLQPPVPDQIPCSASHRWRLPWSCLPSWVERHVAGPPASWPL